MTDMEAILDAAFAKALPGSKFRSRDPVPQVQPEKSRLPGSWGEAHKTAIASPRWRDQVKLKLQNGLGVEDIAIWLDCHTSHIRAEVSRLRAAGDFRKWWGA